MIVRGSEGVTATLLDHTIKETHNPESGRFDALRFARELALDANDMARILHRSPSGIRKNPDAPAIQTELARLVRLVRDLSPLLDDSLANVRIWLHAPHPELGDRAPLALLREGRIAPVEALVAVAIAGQPG